MCKHVGPIVAQMVAGADAVAERTFSAAEVAFLRAEDDRAIARLKTDNIGLKRVADLAQGERATMSAVCNRQSKKLDMIAAIADSAKAGTYGCLQAEIADAILNVIERAQLPEQPCENCAGPKLRGDGRKCEWCGSKFPTRRETHPEEFVGRDG